MYGFEMRTEQPRGQRWRLRTMSRSTNYIKIRPRTTTEVKTYDGLSQKSSSDLCGIEGYRYSYRNGKLRRRMSINTLRRSTSTYLVLTSVFEDLTDIIASKDTRLSNEHIISHLHPHTYQVLKPLTFTISSTPIFIKRFKLMWRRSQE